MSNWSGGGKGRSANKGWRDREDATKTPIHQWQSKSTTQSKYSGSAKRRRNLQWFFYSLLGIFLLGVFLYILLSNPTKTPMVMVMGTSYSAPVPPNYWIYEDRTSFNELEKSLSIIDIPEKIGGSSEWDQFVEELKRHADTTDGFRRVREPLLIYFSMPGVVDEAGKPCLLPPGASPFRSEEWRTVESIFAAIAEAVPDRSKLLIFDSSQELINWKMGIVYNTFSERLKEFVADQKIPNLAVLTAADDGQVSWSSPQLQGTVFGQYLRLGLAGAADRGGDNEVSLDELSDYLQDEVEAWAHSNRNADQRPVLIKSSPDLNFLVTHVVDGDKIIEGYQTELAKRGKSDPSVSLDRIAELWNQLDALKALDLVRYDPITLAEYERDLLRLERLAYAGQAYKDEASRLEGKLSKELTIAVKNVIGNSPALADHWTGKTTSTRITANLNSLPLRLYFGEADQASTTQVQEFLDRLLQAVSGGRARHAKSDAALIQSAFSLPDTQILIAAYQQQVNQESANSDYLRRILQLRKRGEQLGVPTLQSSNETDQSPPGDERAHYYVRLALNNADKARRLAEDDLFAQGAAPSRESWVTDAEKSYDQANDIQIQATEALKTSDKASAELPYLAEWQCRLNSDDRMSNAPNKDIKNTLKLLRESESLGETLGGLQDLPYEESDRNKIATLVAVTVDVNKFKEIFQQLSNEYLKECNKLEQSRNLLDAKGMRDLEAVLATPLMDSKLRKKLLEIRDELSSVLQHKSLSMAVQSTPDLGVDKQPYQDDNALVSVSEKVDKSGLSPLLAILAPQESPVDRSTTDPLDRLDAQSWMARNKLRDLNKPNVEGPPAHVAANSDAEPLSDRLPLSRAESRARSIAPLIFKRPQKDPISDLRFFDLQQLLLWHAHRSLDNFWHIVAPENSTSIDELLAPSFNAAQVLRPGYADTANHYLQLAADMYPSYPQGVKQQIVALRQLLKQRLDASEHGLQVSAESEPDLDSPNNIDVNLSIEADRDGPDLPNGQAVVYFADQGVRLDNVSPLKTITVPIQHQVIKQDALASGVKNRSLDAVVFFRGRQYQQPFQVNNLAGAEVKYNYPVYDRQSVQLKGNQPRPPSVIFILDCSWSMGEPIKAEGKSVAQMEVAKAELDSMLRELAERRSPLPHVGVFFFGHRVGWYTDEFKRATGNVARNSKAAKEEEGIQPNLAPGDDVERILSLGELGSVALGDVLQRLANVKYWGITPVNLSIKRALDEFKGKDSNYSKSIIVITDGKNDQRHVAASGLNAPEMTSTDDVIKAWKDNGENIPVYIVGFRVKAEEAIQAADDFKRIAKETDGEWFPANSGAELIKFLQEQLQIQGYVVNALVDGHSKPITKDKNDKESPVALNTPISIPDYKYPLPAEVEIKFQAEHKQVTLEGGEALILREKQSIIGPEPYREGVETIAELEDGDSSTLHDLRLQIHRAKRIGNRVDFRFSVQDQKYHYTPRPKEIWIEVTPKDSGQTYMFYDTVYEPDTPVPVVKFEAPNWPSDRDEAVVKFWCGYQPTASVMSERLINVPNLESAEAVYRPVPEVPDTKIRIGLQTVSQGYKVLVDERFSGRSSLGAIRVGLNFPSNDTCGMKSVSHLFDSNNGKARHQFTFASNLSKQDFAKQVSVEIVKAATLKAGSFKLGESTEVEFPIHNSNSTHDPSAASASF